MNMKCRGCQAELAKWNALPLSIMYGHTIIKCPLCNFVNTVILDCNTQEWKIVKEENLLVDTSADVSNVPPFPEA